MKLDKNFTQQIVDYLAIPEDERDVLLGAQLLLKLNSNKFFFVRVTRFPEKFKAKLFYELQKILKYRLAHETQNGIEIKSKEVERTVEPLFVAKYKGKRDDHDLLPDDIKACYTENATLMKEMRDLHTKLRIKSNDKKYLPCDRYDDLTCLISIKDKYLKNWELYDNAQVVNPNVESSVDQTTSSNADVVATTSEENYTKKPTTAKTTRKRSSRGK